MTLSTLHTMGEGSKESRKASNRILWNLEPHKILHWLLEDKSWIGFLKIVYCMGHELGEIEFSIKMRSANG